MKKYRIIFYLSIDIKNMLDENEIDYAIKIIDTYKYCVIVKHTNRLYENISDDNLCIKLLGSEYTEFLAYTYRID